MIKEQVRYIAFTGHRNKKVDPKELVAITEYINVIWVHGGAKGFDTQISKFAKVNGIPELIIKPDYENYGRSAPLIRNCEIVNKCFILYACYDGRLNGGTFFTINQAKKANKQVIILPAIQNTFW